MTEERTKALARLREPFAADEIELLPKYTGPMKEVNGRKVPANERQNCKECGGYHAFPAVHLSYVGHAGITQRLLDVDPDWDWEPLALTPAGSPLMSDGGMWIKLTVLGKTRIGFGDAQGKTGPNATKEIIGDAIRNAAMRFGVGTYLWSKSEAAKAMLVRGIEGHDADDSQDDTPAPRATSGGITPKQAGYLVGKAKEYGYTRDDITVTAKRKYGLAPDESGKYDLVGLTKAQMDELLAAMKAHPRTQGDEEIADKMDEVAAELVGEDAGYADEEIPF